MRKKLELITTFQFLGQKIGGRDGDSGVISLEKKHQREKQIFIFRTN